jgi:hypothetical protein
MKELEEKATSVNRHCICKTLDVDKLKLMLNKEFDFDLFFKDRPNLFSNTGIYLSKDDFKNISELIHDIETVIATENFQSLVLGHAPKVASTPTKSKGVFMGYDFHLTNSGPKLIEINTNAGGAYLNLILARAQIACCEGTISPVNLEKVESLFVSIFLSEWYGCNPDSQLKTLAIIDQEPASQFLYPEFQMFSSLFAKNGIECLILDPKELTFVNHQLIGRGKVIDLVYNRLTDFYFDLPESRSLMEAFRDNATVVTPNPHHHALYSNKFNLEVLTDEKILADLKVDSKLVQKLLDGIPKTVKMKSSNQDLLWKERKKYFFKPSQGFGSKAVYRGDKITSKVWQYICDNDYVAQELTPPGQRVALVGNEQVDLKVDLRAYTFDGEVLLLAARLYSGQTTNFRTPGGGFAPVFLI